MKKLILIIALLLSGCALISTTPDDFPSPPTTVIVEFPTQGFITPTPAPRPQPITQEKMQDARTFFLILYTRVLSGDDYGVSQNIKYPITVDIDGSTIITTGDDFLANYDRIFNSKVMDALMNTSEEELILLPEGIRVGHGEIWFNLFCMDAACTDTQFLITQINN